MLCLPFSYEPSYKYYLAINPLTSALYLSDGQTRQIYQIRNLKNIPNISSNLILVAGTGAPCLPADPDGCGDNGQATNAKLLNPKGELPFVNFYLFIFYLNIANQ